jgi:hypothetical protein
MPAGQDMDRHIGTRDALVTRTMGP